MRFDPLAAAVLPDPYPYYRHLRSHDPVHWGVAGDPRLPGTWYLTRYADVMAALKDQRFGREVDRVLPPDQLPPPAPEFRPLFEVTKQWMILRDPPAHTRLRGLVNKAFTPRMIDALHPRISAAADSLLGAALHAGNMDLIADFARLLPVVVIAELLGIPGGDRGRFMPWAITLASTIELRQTPEVYHRGTEAMLALNEYLRGIIAQRRQRPRADLISALLRAEEQASSLSEDEILGTITLLLTAGNDPTMHLIGNAMLALLRHPEQFALLRDDPQLIETAVDELLRFDSPVQMTFRFALQDVELGGKLLRAGDHVALVLGSALHDEAFCSAPDRLDITRPTPPSVPFGFGIHFCLGAALARAEGQIAIQALLLRLPDLALATEPPAWQETAAVRGVKALPVTFTSHAVARHG